MTNISSILMVTHLPYKHETQPHSTDYVKVCPQMIITFYLILGDVIIFT